MGGTLAVVHHASMDRPFSEASGFDSYDYSAHVTDSLPHQSAPSRTSKNYWSPELETVARQTMTQARGYAWMYERVVYRAKKWGSFLSIISGALAGIVGTGGLISTFTPSDKPPLWVGIMTAVIGYMIAIVVVIDNNWKLGVVHSEGLMAQVGFANLSRSITYQLALHPSDRQDAREFVKGILNEIETMKLSSPTIGGKVKTEYISKFKDNPIYDPKGRWEEDYRSQIRQWHARWDDSDDVSSESDTDGYRDYRDHTDNRNISPALNCVKNRKGGTSNTQGIQHPELGGGSPIKCHSAPRRRHTPARATPLASNSMALSHRNWVPPLLNHDTVEKMLAKYDDSMADQCMNSSATCEPHVSYANAHSV